MENADALGRQLEAVRAERAAAEEAGRKQHAALLARDEALSAAQQKTLVRGIVVPQLHAAAKAGFLVIL